MKSKREILILLKDVRADYVATCRDNHGLKKSVAPFDPAKSPIVGRMDEAINELQSDLRQCYPGLKT